MGLLDNLQDWIEEQGLIPNRGSGQTVTQTATQTQDIDFVPDIDVAVIVDTEPLEKVNRSLAEIVNKALQSQNTEPVSAGIRSASMPILLGLVLVGFYLVTQKSI